MMQNDEIKALLQKYSSGGKLTAEEKALLESWYIQQASNKDVHVSEQAIEQHLKTIAGNLPLKRSSPALLYTLWPKVAAAAVILLACGLWYLLSHRTSEQPVVPIATTPVQLVQPGSDGAILTLANGTRIQLDTIINNGIIATQSSTLLVLENGKLVYKELPGGDSPGAPTYNTMATPRGRQFQLTLPDGTKVWLNAASSIRYPTAFTGKERNVEITGEAYFEVATLRLRSGQAMPFHVKSNKQDIEVLGTHFNVMAYDDEPAVKTTLLEGKIRLKPVTGDAAILKPGEQATTTDKIKIARVKTEAAVAWKNGEFMFRDEPLENIMRSVARWYDVEIEYKADVKQKAVWGAITKYSNVQEVLEMINLTGVAHFKVEGRKIIVLP